MSGTKAMQRLCGLMRKAVQQYEMLSPGDRVLVGVSGGKDSVALTVGLAQLRQYLGFPFEVTAVTLDPQFGGQPVDYSALEALFRQYGVPYEVRRTLIGPIVFDYRKEKNPCSLCANLRRGALHAAAEELGCNKVSHCREGVGLPHREKPLPRRRRDHPGGHKGLRPGALPHRPGFPAEDAPRLAGKRHRRLASPAPGPHIK